MKVQLTQSKLGYGGTKGEMERLLADAEKFSGVHYDIDNLSDVYEAIHVVQGELGISGRTAEEAAEIIKRTGRSEKEVFERLGTTAKEASTTISGSIGMVKSSFQNLIVGFADDTADVGSLVDNFVNSVTTAGGNLIPRIQKILDGAVKVIVVVAEKLLPVVVETIASNLPMLIESALTLTKTIATAIIDSLPQLIDAALEIVFTIGDGLISALPELIPAVVKMVLLIAEKLTDPETIAQLFDAAKEIISALASGIVNAFPILSKIGVDGVEAIIGGIAGALTAAKVIAGITKFISIFKGIAGAITSAGGLIPALTSLISPVGLVVAAIGAVVAIGVLVYKNWDTIKEKAAELKEKIVEVWNNIKTSFSESWQGIKDGAKNAWQSIKDGAKDAWEGIKNAFSGVADWFHNVFSKAWQKVKDVFSAGGKVFAGIKEGIENTFKTVVNALIGGINKIIAVPFKAINNILEKIHSIEILGVSPFDWVQTFEVPEMPLLAKGGIVNRPTQLIAGEAGAEAIVPLENNTEWIQDVASKINKTAGGDSDKILNEILDEMHTVRRELYGIILAALHANSDDFDLSEADMIRLVKKYAFA